MENVIKLSSTIKHDEYVQYVYDKLDIQPSETYDVEIPFNLEELKDFSWKIGLICGNSGSGKTTIANRLGINTTPSYDYNKCVISQFEQFGFTPQEASSILFNVGIASIPTWLNKPNQLSNGERARLDVAMKLAAAKDGDTIVIDEWTSVVNRDVAKAMSNSIQKYIRNLSVKVIFVSCHYDIIDWLQCDWIYNLNNRPCEIEQLIYTDDAQYNVFKDLNQSSILSNEVAL